MFSLQGDSSASDKNFYGSGSQNPRLGWGELYTPSPQSPDSAPAPLQRNYQFHQGAYMYNNQQMTALHDRCKALETQVIKLTTERDTLQAKFQQLADPLQQSGNPLALDPTFPAQLGSNDANRPTPQTHPKNRFWTQIDYVEWLDTSMGRLSDRGKLGYLENGGPIATTMVKDIRKALRAGCTSYSAWRRTYLSDDGNWMTLKTNGTTEEFCAHYGDLTPTQRKAYDDESASLSWNKTAYDGTMY
ncbi:hypothetical protein DFJ58DRAFT_847699 [Suillus subalutaceus]|uniref:uncharacterized protein n=1 Tax=Suillus subalutaceus TaxID=48586 RepID=UPI001B881E37|nr:uncharacterized protein DFJ58DRAFT_847699 [Suillus subalutaceus]KAG1834017.1 hypothetical protein DFJ58DRAFT_847699 [Suillus subalutaceus]